MALPEDYRDDSTARSLQFDAETSMSGYQLRDAELDDVAHYFEYEAERHAEMLLDSPDPDEGEELIAHEDVMQRLRRAA